MDDDTDIDGLAGEYVLGALEPAERVEVARRLATDARLAAAVAEWERLLSPLGWQTPGIDPGPRSLDGILAVVTQKSVAAARPDNVVRLQRRLRRWQWTAGALAAGVAALAVGLATVVLRHEGSGGGSLVAVLASDGRAAADEPTRDSSPVFVAGVDRSRTALTLRQVAGRSPVAGRTYVVWLSDKASGVLVAVGAVEKGSAIATLKLPSAVAAGTVITVSAETNGAGPWERPRGPVVSVGTLEP